MKSLVNKKNDKDYTNNFVLESMYCNTFDMAYHITASSFLGGSIGLFWPFAIPATIKMLLEYKNIPEEENALLENKYLQILSRNKR